MTGDPWMIAVATLLVVSLCLYVLLGGADFGGGILEATLPEHLRKKLQATMAPIWEANHVWLIAVIVLLFVGFPKFYALSMTRLYVPMSLALLSILLRGVFFTLRKYDPNPRHLSGLYSVLFRTSSAGAPLLFGFILGGLLTTHPGSPTQLPLDSSFAEIYLAPWLHPFGALCGAFVTCLFGYLAAVFFFGDAAHDPEPPARAEPVAWSTQNTPDQRSFDPQEGRPAPEEDRRLLRRRVWQFFCATFVLGGLVLSLGAVSGRVPLAKAMDPVFWACQMFAFFGIFAVARALAGGHVWRARFFAGGQVVAILGGWFSAQYPALLRTTGGTLLLSDAAAPRITLLWLTIGFLVVLAMVLPLMVILFRVFQAPVSDQSPRR